MITILGNVGNAGFALPMVQAYPIDVNAQQLLVWNPTLQALDYVPYVGNALGDFGVTRDLSVGRDVAVTRNASIGGTLGVTGVLTTQVASPAVIPTITGDIQLLGTGNFRMPTAGRLYNGANQVVGLRDTGWAAMTGTPDKTTKATGTVTLPQLAGIVMALQAALIAHGLIGT